MESGGGGQTTATEWEAIKKNSLFVSPVATENPRSEVSASFLTRRWGTRPARSGIPDFRVLRAFRRRSRWFQEDGEAMGLLSNCGHLSAETQLLLPSGCWSSPIDRRKTAEKTQTKAQTLNTRSFEIACDCRRYISSKFSLLKKRVIECRSAWVWTLTCCAQRQSLFFRSCCDVLSRKARPGLCSAEGQ